MSNVGNHTISIFEDDLETIKEFIKISFNTIFYHRWLNNTNYIEEESNIKNISYMKINEKSLEDKINDILKQIENKSKSNNKFQITINFYTKKSYTFYFYENLEGLWETWSFLIKISDDSSNDKEKKIRKYISNILKELNKEPNFMPDINLDLNEIENNNNNNSNKTDELNFPYEIIIDNEFSEQTILSLFNNINNLNPRDSFNRIL